MSKVSKLLLVATIPVIALTLSGCSQPTPTATVTVTADPTEVEVETTESTEPEVVDPKWEDFLEANLVEFSVSKAECSYSDGSLELRVTLTNLSDRNIVAIDAVALINDIFDEEIKGLNISSDESLAAGDSVNVGSWGSSCYDLNQFSSEDNRLLDMEDLDKTTDVVIEVRKIAFEDGEVLEF